MQDYKIENFNDEMDCPFPPYRSLGESEKEKLVSKMGGLLKWDGVDLIKLSRIIDKNQERARDVVPQDPSRDSSYDIRSVLTELGTKKLPTYYASLPRTKSLYSTVPQQIKKKRAQGCLNWQPPSQYTGAYSFR